jgi:hypothetical protein
LIIDGAHLAEGATVEACEPLARAGGELPCWSPPAYRPESTAPTVVRALVGLDRAGCTVMELDPHAEAESTALVEAEIPVAADTARVSQIVATAEATRSAGWTGPPGAAGLPQPSHIQPGPRSLRHRLVLLADCRESATRRNCPPLVFMDPWPPSIHLPMNQSRRAMMRRLAVSAGTKAM